MRIAIVLLLLAACGDDVCPAALAGSTEWTARTAEPECAELAAALNMLEFELAGGGGGCGAGFELEAQGDQCVATLRARCEGVDIEAECDVSSDGAADCEARVRTAGLDCSYLLTVR